MAGTEKCEMCASLLQKTDNVKKSFCAFGPFLFFRLNKQFSDFVVYVSQPYKLINRVSNHRIAES